MAGKDFGIYREAGGGASLTNTWSDLTFDTNVQQDSGFTRSGGTVTQGDEGVLLAIYGVGAEENGGGAACVRLDLQQDTGSGFGGVKGGRAYTSFDDSDGVDAGQAFGVTMIDGSASDDYKLRARTQISGETADEAANRTSLQLLQIPQDFDVCILSESSNDSNIGSGFGYLTWDTTDRIDTASFSTASNGGIQAKTAGRYMLVYNVCFELDDNPSGTAEGCMFHVVATLNATVGGASVSERINHTFRRKTAPHFATPSTAANVALVCFVDLAANDVVRLHRRYLNKGTSTDQVDVLGAQSVFSMVRIDDATPSHGAIELRRTSTVTGWTGSQVIDWNTLTANDGSSFTHSTSTNPSRVTYPTGKTLTMVGIGLNRGSGVDSTAAWTGQMKRAGSTLHSYGVGGSGVNLGQPSGEPVQNQSDLAIGFLYDASGDYFEVQTDELGTAADSASTLRGGADGWGSLFQAIDIESWPDDQITGSGAGSLPLGTGTGSGSLLLASSGAAVSLPVQSGTGSGGLLVSGSGAGLAPVALGSSSGSLSLMGSGAALLGPPAGSGAGGLDVAASGQALLPVGSGSGTGALLLSGFGVALLPLPTASGVGTAGTVVDFYMTASNAVRARWKTLVADVLALATQYDNLPFTKPADTLYARVSVELEDARIASSGAGHLTEADGTLVVTLYQPAMLGVKPALDTADLVMAAFREVRDATVVGDDVVRFYTPSIVRRSQGGAKYVVRIECPFRAEQTAAVATHTTPLLGLDSQDVGAALRGLWEVQIETPFSLPTQYDSLPFTRPAASQWARLTILDGDSPGHVEAGLTRSVGVLMAQVFTSAEAGEKSGLELMDAINRVFRHREAQGLRLGAPRLSPGMRTGPWWQHTVSIPWQADQFT